MKRRRISIALASIAWLVALAPSAPAQVFGPVGGVSPPVNLPVTGTVNAGYAAYSGYAAYPGYLGPNSFYYADYGGIGPYGGPAYGRILAGTNVVGYSNNSYSSYSGQYGGFGLPGLSNRAGGYSARSSGFSIGAGGATTAYGATDSFGYVQPGLIPGARRFGVGAGGAWPLGAQGSVRSSGTTTFLPTRGN